MRVGDGKTLVADGVGRRFVDDLSVRHDVKPVAEERRHIDALFDQRRSRYRRPFETPRLKQADDGSRRRRAPLRPTGGRSAIGEFP
jgi:hypothetical protein